MKMRVEVFTEIIERNIALLISTLNSLLPRGDPGA